MKNKLVTLLTVLTLSTVAACDLDPAQANTATNRQTWEHSTGTRKVTGSAYTKGDRFTIKDSQVLKLDGTGDGAKGDIYFRNGELSGGYWSVGNDGGDGKVPGFVAGYAATETTIENEWYGSQTNFESKEHYTAGSDEFTIGDL